MARNRYTKEFLERVTRNVNTWADVCRVVGIKPFTGAQYHLRNQAVKFGIDTSHFIGQAWSKGKRLGPKRPVDAYLTTNSTAKSHDLKERLIKEGLKEAKCEICGLTEWRGEPAPLELDHKNSDHWDNRLENLQIVCSNCHTIETRLRRRSPTGEAADLESASFTGSNPVVGTNGDLV